MTPVHCQVKHSEEAGTYGDCVRACVASLLDMEADAVPHFFHDNCDGYSGHARIKEFLATLGYAPFWANAGDDPRPMMDAQNAETHYMLFGSTAYGEHVVICRGGVVAHDPAWVEEPLINPGEHGYWTILVIAKS